MDNVAELADDDKDLGFEYTKGNQIADVFLMFLAGTDTTSLSLEWGFILLAMQSQIQSRVRTELQTVLKQNNIDYKSSSSNIVYDIKLLRQLPLFRALIWEILRISCVGRLGSPHSISGKDEWITTSDGEKYCLPKGSALTYNVECINFGYLGNENWKNKQNGLNPQEICLDNWLKEESNEFYQNTSFITFGHGKRDCIGKQLALKEMRVILGYFLLNYTFALPEKYSKMREIPMSGGGIGIAKPKEEIPLAVRKIKY